MVTYEGSINWNKTNSEIISFVEKNFQEGAKAFSFIFGFKIEILKCKEGQNKPEFSSFEIGSIIGNSNGEFIVKSKNGSIVVTKYVIQTPYVNFENLENFLEKIRLQIQPKLTPMPFMENRDANRWETLYQKFVMDETQLKEYENELGFKQVTLESKNNKKLSSKKYNEHDQTLINKNRKFIQYIIKKVGLKKGDRVLDLGCATGWATSIFESEGLEAHGADISPSSIKEAKDLLPSANFFVLDIFDLSKHENLKGKFDFVFCRDLGVAQKIVNWEDEEWQNVGKGLMEILSERGVLFWIQMGNLSGEIYQTSFSNPKMETLLKFFRKYGDVLDLDIFSYQCFLVTKKNQNKVLMRQITKFNQNKYDDIYSWWITEKSVESIKEFSKVIYSKFSKLFLLDQKILENGVVIFGNNKIANAYYKLLHEKNLFSVFCSNDLKVTEYLGLKVYSINEVINLKSSILIVTDPDQLIFLKENGLESSFEYIIDAFNYNENYFHEKIYLLSGDQDETIGNALLPPLMEILG